MWTSVMPLLSLWWQFHYFWTNVCKENPFFFLPLFFPQRAQHLQSTFSLFFFKVQIWNLLRIEILLNNLCNSYSRGKTTFASWFFPSLLIPSPTFSPNKTTRQSWTVGGAVLTPPPSCMSGCGQSPHPSSSVFCPPLAQSSPVHLPPPPSLPAAGTSTLVSNFHPPAPDGQRIWEYSLKLAEAWENQRGKNCVTCGCLCGVE